MDFRLLGLLAVVKNELCSMTRGKLITSIYNMILHVKNESLSQINSEKMQVLTFEAGK